MDLLYILRILKQRIWILIGIPLLSVIFAAYFVSKIVDKYKSSAQIASGSMTDESVNLSELKSGSYEVNSRITNIIESMNSIPVVSLVSYQLILHDLEEDTPFREMRLEDLDFEWNEEVKKEFISVFKDRLSNLKPLNTFEEQDNRLLTVLYSYRYDYGTLMDDLTIKRQGSSDFINVEFISENPLLSAYMVNTFCKEFIRFNRVNKADKSSESIELLETLLKQKKDILDEKTATLNTYKEVNQVYNFSAESQQKIDQLTEYELSREAELKKISGLTLSLNMIDSKIKPLQEKGKDEVMQVSQRIIELRRKINEAVTNNVDANSVNQLRDELQLEMGRLAAINNADQQEELKQLLKDKDTYSLELQIAKSNLATIEQSLGKLKSNVSGFAGKEAEMANLQLQVQLASDEYLNAQERFNEAQNKALVAGTLLRQVIQGQPSKDPEPANSILLVGLAGFGSLALVVIVVLGLEFVDFSIRTQEKLETLTGLKSMGTVNEINNQDLNLPKVFALKNKAVEIDRFVHSLRKLRFDIQNSNSKYFLVTSTQDNVGKSFITVCIAYALSLTNKRVLIIDTNFKNNSLTKLLIPKSDQQKLLSKGLMAKSTLLLSEGKKTDKTEDENFTRPESEETEQRSIVQNTIYQNVDIIGNQGGTESPFEILAGRDFSEMLHGLGAQYDYIILEGAALNEYSDSKELMDFVEKIIPVFSAHTTLNNLDKESIKYLKSMDSKLMGAVLNNVKLKDLKV
jgi:polysaccharide biosynthesis transport protein